jgi:hypothetical protein
MHATTGFITFLVAFGEMTSYHICVACPLNISIKIKTNLCILLNIFLSLSLTLYCIKRIKLTYTTDQWTRLVNGKSEGIIVGIHYNDAPYDRYRVLSVSWDSGSNLMLIDGIDDYEIIG